MLGQRKRETAAEFAERVEAVRLEAEAINTGTQDDQLSAGFVDAARRKLDRMEISRISLLLAGGAFFRDLR